MNIVFLTAIGVGGATIFGSVVGFVSRGLFRGLEQLLLSFCAGIMLCAAISGLILPALELSDGWLRLMSIGGILAGGLCMEVLNGLVSRIQHRMSRPCDTHSRRVLLFVAAIAIHNFPEGIAAGVSFGSGSNAQALLIAGGIALQNIPEGMVIIAPLLSIGVSRRKTLLLAFLTGATEILGTLVGYIAISAAAAILPFALAFAGGTMLHVICAEMIPNTCGDSGHAAAFSLLTGFCAMLLLDALLP